MSEKMLLRVEVRTGGILSGETVAAGYTRSTMEDVIAEHIRNYAAVPGCSAPIVVVGPIELPSGDTPATKVLASIDDTDPTAVAKVFKTQNHPRMAREYRVEFRAAWPYLLIEIVEIDDADDADDEPMTVDGALELVQEAVEETIREIDRIIATENAQFVADITATLTALRGNFQSMRDWYGDD